MTNETAPAELLPCPFCGGTSAVKVCEWDREPFFPGYYVVCSASGWDGAPGRGCGCGGAWGNHPHETITAWNRRTPLNATSIVAGSEGHIDAILGIPTPAIRIYSGAEAVPYWSAEQMKADLASPNAGRVVELLTREEAEAVYNALRHPLGITQFTGHSITLIREAVNGALSARIPLYTQPQSQRIAEPIGIRICPERDGPCPHGAGCAFWKDRYRCDMAASRRALSPPQDKGGV
jgi:hypothetical protein